MHTNSRSSISSPSLLTYTVFTMLVQVCLHRSYWRLHSTSPTIHTGTQIVTRFFPLEFFTCTVPRTETPDIKLQLFTVYFPSIPFISTLRFNRKDFDNPEEVVMVVLRCLSVLPYWQIDRVSEQLLILII